MMRLHLFPPSARALGIVALKDHLALECELVPVDLSRGDQRTAEYESLNPNRKIPTLEDDGFVLWESNAILFYLAAKRPERGLWPAEGGAGTKLTFDHEGFPEDQVEHLAKGWKANYWENFEKRVT